MTTLQHSVGIELAGLRIVHFARKGDQLPHQYVMQITPTHQFQSFCIINLYAGELEFAGPDCKFLCSFTINLPMILQHHLPIKLIFDINVDSNLTVRATTQDIDSKDVELIVENNTLNINDAFNNDNQ